METINSVEDYENFVKQVTNPNVPDHLRAHWAVGELASEAGEALGVTTKGLRKAEPVNVEKLRDELGDTLWGLVASAQAIGTDLYGLMYHNHQKLSLRLNKEPERMGLSNGE